jgi:mitochondrial fission protein ELM1
MNSVAVDALLACGQGLSEDVARLEATARHVPILAEDKAGMMSQAIGLAEAARWQPDPRPLLARGIAAYVPSPWWWRPLSAIDPRALAAPFGDVAIGCGRMAGAVLAGLRRRARTVIIQNPAMDIRRFDLVMAAAHDELTGPNVVVTRTALHRVTEARLRAAAAEWAPRLAHLPRPLVAVLVGGSNGRFRLDQAVAGRLAGELAEMMRRDRVGLVVTPSRRTDPAARQVLAQTLAPLGAEVWDMTGDNPYFGMLALADAIVATCDSVSMISEAVATPAPVLVAALPGRSRRIGIFLRSLIEAGRVRPFAGRLETWPVAPLDDTAAAAAEMCRRLGVEMGPC